MVPYNLSNAQYNFIKNIQEHLLIWPLEPTKQSTEPPKEIIGPPLLPLESPK